MTRGTALRRVGAIGIISLAALRALVTFAPRVVFDVDPAIDPNPFAGLGPAGSLLIDVLTLIACAVAWIGVALESRERDVSDGVSWWLVLLAFLPLPILIGHGVGDPGDLWLGVTWFSGAAAAVTLVAAVARDGELRAILVALLLASVAPIIVRGVMQSDLPMVGYVGPEHAETLAEFEFQRDAIFADRGWESDSAAALIFERRLRQAQPVAWFPTSNIYASVAGAALVMLAGLGFWARGAGGGTRIILGALALAAIVTVAQAGSKGALGALALGVVAIAIGAVMMRRGVSQRVLVWLALGAVGLTMAGVVARGTVLPESFANDRSLLFRWHYASATGRIVADAPLTGVGPAGFQHAYVRERPARSPEEVASAHNVFADWLAATGLAGAAWVTLALVLATRIGRTADGGPEDEPSDGQEPRLIVIATCAALVVAVGGAIVVEQAALDSVDLVARAVGLVLFLLTALAGYAAWRVTAPRIRALLLAAAALVLVVHGQIEMTWTQPAAILWCWCVLGLAASGAKGRPRGPRRAWMLGVALIVTALGTLVIGVVPAHRTQRGLIEAAGELWPIAHARGSVRWLQLASPGDLPAAAAILRTDLLAAGVDESTVSSLFVTPIVRTPAWFEQILTALRAAESEARRRAGDRLAAIDDDDARRHTARQYGRLLARASVDPETATRIRAKAHERLAPLIARDDLGALSLTIGLTNDRDESLACARRLTELDPNGLFVWKQYADLLAASHPVEAPAAYERVLEIDANYALDPLKQLSEADRAECRRRAQRSSVPPERPQTIPG